MRFDALPLFADENIHPDVIRWLRDRGFDVVSVVERAQRGSPDLALLAAATAEGRAVLTHDADFGALAIASRQPLIGVVYLRPGHFDPAFTIGTIETLIAQSPDLVPPFVVVAHRSGDTVSVRVRQL